MRRLTYSLAVLVILSWVPTEVTAGTIFDTFDDGNADGWIFPFNRDLTQAAGGSWSVENGTLVQHFFTDGNCGLVDNVFLADQLIEVESRTAGYAGVVLWYQQVNADTANYISIVFNAGYGQMIVSEIADTIATTQFYGGPNFLANWLRLSVEADSVAGKLTVTVSADNGPSFSFTHLASTPYRTGLSGIYSGNEVGYFDNFQVTSNDIATVPEPATLASWISIALAGIAGWRRKRKAAADGSLPSLP